MFRRAEGRRAHVPAAHGRTAKAMQFMAIALLSLVTSSAVAVGEPVTAASTVRSTLPDASTAAPARVRTVVPTRLRTAVRMPVIGEAVTGDGRSAGVRSAWRRWTPARSYSWFLPSRRDRTPVRYAAADQGAASPASAQRWAGKARWCLALCGYGESRRRKRRGWTGRSPGRGDRTVARTHRRSAMARRGAPVLYRT